MSAASLRQPAWGWWPSELVASRATASDTAAWQSKSQILDNYVAKIFNREHRWYNLPLVRCQVTLLRKRNYSWVMTCCTIVEDCGTWTFKTALTLPNLPSRTLERDESDTQDSAESGTQDSARGYNKNTQLRTPDVLSLAWLLSFPSPVAATTQ